MLVTNNIADDLIPVIRENEVVIEKFTPVFVATVAMRESCTYLNNEILKIAFQNILLWKNCQID